MIAAMLIALSVAADPAPPPDFVYLRDIAPGIVQDIRYAGAHNFTAVPVSGYEAAECVLSRPAAVALADIQAELEKDALSLIVWDCYRPARAVAAFMAWTANGSDTMKPVFFPNVDRQRLVELGYIAARSGHSGGSVVDLGLAPFGYIPAPATATACVGPQTDGLPDMGTAFDCFDPLSAWDAPVSDAARANRTHLRAVMERHGFTPYAAEWWHFRLANEPYAGQFFDLPITARPGTP